MRFFLFAIILFSFFSCSEKQEHKGKTPLVEVNGMFLYKEDVVKSTPVGLSAADSLRFVKDYIRKWSESVLLYEKAKNNIPDNEEIERMVNNYKRDLIVNAYQSELLNQKLNADTTNQALVDYYETIKDKIRWKLRRYDKLAQITSEYSEDEKNIFFNKYPNVPLVRTELQISDTQFLNQFQPHFLNQEIDLVDILKKWNKRRKVDIIENELIQTSPLIESSLETFNQNGLRVGLCKANPSGVSDSLNKLIEWIDNDPLAKPEEIVNQMVSAMGHNEPKQAR
jgi:hypothetical protein